MSGQKSYKPLKSTSIKHLEFFSDSMRFSEKIRKKTSESLKKSRADKLTTKAQGGLPVNSVDEEVNMFGENLAGVNRYLLGRLGTECSAERKEIVNGAFGQIKKVFAKIMRKNKEAQLELVCEWEEVISKIKGKNEELIELNRKNHNKTQRRRNYSVATIYEGKDFCIDENSKSIRKVERNEKLGDEQEVRILFLKNKLRELCGVVRRSVKGDGKDLRSELEQKIRGIKSELSKFGNREDSPQRRKSGNKTRMLRRNSDTMQGRTNSSTFDHCSKDNSLKLSQFKEDIIKEANHRKNLESQYLEKFKKLEKQLESAQGTTSKNQAVNTLTTIERTFTRVSAEIAANLTEILSKSQHNEKKLHSLTSTLAPFKERLAQQQSKSDSLLASLHLEKASLSSSLLQLEGTLTGTQELLDTTRANQKSQVASLHTLTSERDALLAELASLRSKLLSRSHYKDTDLSSDSRSYTKEELEQQIQDLLDENLSIKEKNETLQSTIIRLQSGSHAHELTIQNLTRALGPHYTGDLESSVKQLVFHPEAQQIADRTEVLSLDEMSSVSLPSEMLNLPEITLEDCSIEENKEEQIKLLKSYVKDLEREMKSGSLDASLRQSLMQFMATLPQLTDEAEDLALALLKRFRFDSAEIQAISLARNKPNKERSSFLKLFGKSK